MNFNALIDQVFRAAQGFADGDAGDFGVLILSIILVMQAVTGGAELLTGSDSRVKKGGFWVRIAIVIFCALAFDSIFIDPPRVVAKAALGDYFTTWKAVWSETVKAVWDGVEAWIKYQMAGSSLGISDMLTMGGATVIKAWFGVGCLILAVAASLFSVIFMLVQSFMAMGMSAFVSACAPVFLPFFAAEETQELGFSYLRTWLVVSMLFLPLLQVALAISATITHAVFTAFFAQPKNAADALQQLMLMAIGPLAGLGILLGAPAAIRSLR